MSAISQILEPGLLERIEGLSLVARRVVEGALHGMHRSAIRGLSVEFAQHREYAPGDDLKHLDWKVLARNDRYVVRQYQQETNLRAVVLLDCSGSMGYRNAQDATAAAPRPSKFAYARILGAALGHLLIAQGDSVGLVLASDRITDQLDARSSPGQVLSMCQMLLAAEPGGATNLSPVLDQLAAGLRRRSLVLLISDLLDDPDAVLGSLGRLHHAGHEAIVMHVLDPSEIDFDFGQAGAGVTVLKDMESGREFEAEPRLIRHLVREEVRKFLKRLDAGAKRAGLHLLQCRTDEEPAEVLTRYLHWRMQGRGAR